MALRSSLATDRGAGMLQRDPGAALLVETWLTNTGHIHGASSLDKKSVQYDRTHQSLTGAVDLYWHRSSFKQEDNYRRCFKLQQNAQ